MSDQQDQINVLLQKLELLLQKQETFGREIQALRQEINLLKDPNEGEAFISKPLSSKPKIKTGELLEEYLPPTPKQKSQKKPSRTPKFELPETFKVDWEKFIGENLISKIGIFILILGVGIGAKYSIDNDLVSPLTRIIFGYLAGLGLLGVGIKLKSNYTNYSAVLVSGAMAILYFITYFAYSFYGLIPQLVAFGLMALFTVFTVIAAIKYNQEVIALIGLVGAYGVPFLLGDGSGNIVTMFGYMTILNIGILITAFKNYWKNVHRAAFLLTWLIYAGWFFSDYRPTEHFTIALAFAGIFFATFYILFLAYKLIKKEQFVQRDIWLILTNAFLFYGFGYGILNENEVGQQLLGLFTLGNAAIHFVVGLLIHRQQLADKNLFYLVVGLVLLFLTIAIPVQLDGNWVTLIWAGEAALLFWIGRTKGVPFYEKMAYPLMALACLSLLEDWTNYHAYYVDAPETRVTAIFNIHFLTSLLFVAAFGFINWLNQRPQFSAPTFKRQFFSSLLPVALPAILIATVYITFYLEIQTYFEQLYKDSVLQLTSETGQNTTTYFNDDLLKFSSIWLLNYTMLFCLLFSLVNAKWLRNAQLTSINLLLNGLIILTFLTQGLYTLWELQQSYLTQELSEYYSRTNFHIIIRYISLALFVGLLTVTYKYLRKMVGNKDYTVIFDFILHTAILVIASSELIYWMDLAQSTQSNKLGITILWGIYALLLIILGIWKRKKHLRIAAIALFAVTLAKLFFYDLIHLNTISKTIVLVSLGILLLLISFLYNKYKHLITDESES